MCDKEIVFNFLWDPKTVRIALDRCEIVTSFEKVRIERIDLQTKLDHARDRREKRTDHKGQSEEAKRADNHAHHDDKDPPQTKIPFGHRTFEFTAGDEVLDRTLYDLSDRPRDDNQSDGQANKEDQP